MKAMAQRMMSFARRKETNADIPNALASQEAKPRMARKRMMLAIRDAIGKS